MAKQTVTFNADNIPLAIRSRVSDISGKLEKVDRQNADDAARIEQLRADIENTKKRIEQRVIDTDALRQEREALAFAVAAYQDDAPPAPTPKQFRATDFDYDAVLSKISNAPDGLATAELGVDHISRVSVLKRRGVISKLPNGKWGIAANA